MTALDAILEDFKSDVHRAEQLLDLIKEFRQFGASIPPLDMNGQSDNWPNATSLLTASKETRTNLPILSGSLQLYLTGRFEYCIRQIVEAVADEVVTRTTSYGELPGAFRQELRYRTLEVAQNPKRYGYTENESDALLTSLVSSMNTAADKLSITSRVLSTTDSNMKAFTLADILKRVGLTDFWKDVGKQASVKLVLEKKTDDETMKEAQARLNSIMDERNQVAHPTASTDFPDPDRVLCAAKFLRVLATTTVDLAKVYISSYKPIEPEISSILPADHLS